MKRKFRQDDTGVSVLIDYIINFGVLIILLTLVYLLYQSIIVQSNSTIAHEEYRVFANDIANRIVLFDSAAKATTDQGGNFANPPVLTFDTPKELAGMGYTIDVGTDSAAPSNNVGHVTISSSDRYDIAPITATFNTAYPIIHAQLPGSSMNHTIVFYSGNQTIGVT